MLRDDRGKPWVRLYGGAREEMDKLGIDAFHVSITNTKDYAVAVAVGEGSQA